ncbi:MAG: hypothetical protein Q6364_06885 [Candidatus Hermodarchaeota archaeon]|nr:hypothetical protein [Candidatus Hermodarchaeota archaeon]
MSTQTSKKRNRRRELYLIAGLVVGICLMITPVLFHATMGSLSPFTRVYSEGEFWASGTIVTPLDVIIELFWLVVPIIFLIIVLYVLGGRRTRWAGYDEAVKLTRR